MMASSAGLSNLAVTDGGEIIGSSHIDYIGGDGHGSASVFRLSKSGQPVRSFGTDGHVELAHKDAGGTFPFWYPAGMTIGASGRITITGDGTGVGAKSKGAVRTVRITRSGKVDSSFGPAGDGWVVSNGVSDGGPPLCGSVLTSNGSLAVGVVVRGRGGL